MPIRKGGAKLWFKTQEQIDQYDDRMIAAIELTTTDFESQNYAPVFTRPKKQFFLQPNQKIIEDSNRITAITANMPQFIDKYYIGKRDHTHNREWTFHRFGLGWGVSYLLIRELPIRNFYARCWIMILFLAKVAQTSGSFGNLRATLYGIEDEWTNKDIKNYEIYYDNQLSVVPNHYNKIQEATLWKLAQPGYLRSTPERYLSTFLQVVFPKKEKHVAWDGTFNMPLQGLAHPLHKDAKHLDFITG